MPRVTHQQRPEILDQDARADFDGNRTHEPPRARLRDSLDDPDNRWPLYVLHRFQSRHNVIMAIENARISGGRTEAAKVRVPSVPLSRRIQVAGLWIDPGVLDSEGVAEHVVQLSKAAAEIEYLQGPIDRLHAPYGIDHVPVSLRVQPTYESVEGLVALV